MPRGSLITEFERTVIRIGKAKKIRNMDIARALGRTPAAITQQVRAMESDGTINELPLPFFVDDIAEMIRREGAKQ